jgi:predicted SnoaL-like aldol condensation-catalyzing enzyme
MQIRNVSLTALLLAAALPLGAQEPVVGVAVPESLFVDSEPALHRNKQAALHIMRELLQCNQWDRAGEWITERYLQHNPNAQSGLAGVVYYFTQVMNRQPTQNCARLTTEVVAVMAEDDLVTVIIPRSYPDPREAGKTYSTTWFDTWRFVDGKADEHWDPAQIPAP